MGTVTISNGLMTWAEGEYGGGTGSLKLPLMIEQAIDLVLAEAKIRWEKNPKLIEGKKLFLRGGLDRPIYHI